MRKIRWTESARGDVRRLDRDAAMRVFSSLHRFAESGEGDVKRLEGETREFRLRVGDYRVRFTEEPPDIIQIYSVRHRREAYR